VDGATVVSTAIAGAVGLAGIGGTLLAARMTSKSDAENLRMSISAEDARAKLAEKRRIYANCLAALMDFTNALERWGHETKLPPEQRNAEGQDEVVRTRRAAYHTVSEVELIGPTEVARLASRVISALLGSDQNTRLVEITDPLTVLVLEMRRDLGEDVPSREQISDGLGLSSG
jgi:hypothetical protein